MKANIFKILILNLIIGLASSLSLALGFGVEGGFRQQSGDAVTGYSTSSQVGYQLGAVGFFDLSEQFALRSGLMYTQRPLKVTNDGTQESASISLTYFDVPVAFALKFEDYVGVYAGVALSVNLDKSSDKKSVYDVIDVKSFAVPFQFGVTFKFMPELGVNLFFEQFGDAAEGLKSYRSVGANILFTLE